MPGMDDYDAMWDEFLINLHLLSQAQFTGRLGYFYMSHGRISRSTLKKLNDAARVYKDYVKNKEVTCQT